MKGSVQRPPQSRSAPRSRFARKYRFQYSDEAWLIVQAYEIGPNVRTPHSEPFGHGGKSDEPEAGTGHSVSLVRSSVTWGVGRAAAFDPRPRLSSCSPLVRGP